MKKILVKCTLFVPIEVEDDYYNDEFTPEFDIEENHCPGTGIVGSAIDKVMEEADKGRHCWACALKGTNEIVSNNSL